MYIFKQQLGIGLHKLLKNRINYLEQIVQQFCQKSFNYADSWLK